PDVIIGVATGGRYVAEEIGKKINVPLVIIKRQRNSTKKKSKFRMASFLPFLPRPINDLLRIAEIKFNERKFRKSGRILSVGAVAHISGDLEHLRKGKRILIVDDAVDSGGTFIDCIN
ncbi:phosphoribosyltransferase, partial [Serratia marcescens]